MQKSGPHKIIGKRLAASKKRNANLKNKATLPVVGADDISSGSGRYLKNSRRKMRRLAVKDNQMSDVEKLDKIAEICTGASKGTKASVDDVTNIILPMYYSEVSNIYKDIILTSIVTVIATLIPHDSTSLPSNMRMRKTTRDAIAVDDAASTALKSVTPILIDLACQRPSMGLPLLVTLAEAAPGHPDMTSILFLVVLAANHPEPGVWRTSAVASVKNIIQSDGTLKATLALARHLRNITKFITTGTCDQTPVLIPHSDVNVELVLAMCETLDFSALHKLVAEEKAKKDAADKRQTGMGRKARLSAKKKKSNDPDPASPYGYARDMKQRTHDIGNCLLSVVMRLWQWEKVTPAHKTACLSITSKLLDEGDETLRRKVRDLQSALDF